jgi:hypothetical protein
MNQRNKQREEDSLTSHAYLVPMGEYAAEIRVIDVFEKAELRQKTYLHRPQTKVLEAFVGTLAGVAHLKELSRGAHPLDQDQLVADAWGQRQWADYSGVARTLQQLSQAEVDQIVCGLDEINRRFVTQEIESALSQDGYLVVDADLSGLPVCKQSKSYPQTAYGHMDDLVRLGYQVGLVSMHSLRYGRLWLSIQHHPGNVTSATQVLNLVLAAEAALGRHPLRRTDLLAQRVEQVEQSDQELWKQVQEQQQSLQAAQQTQTELEQQLHCYQAKVTQLEQDYAAKDRLERACSQLAKAHQHQIRLQNKLLRQTQRCQRIQKKLERVHIKWAAHEQFCQMLKERLADFAAENQRNPNPVRIRLRLDAGFGTYDNLAVLIEMGYEIFTKARSAQVVRSMVRLVPADHAWVRVGSDALLATWPGFSLPNFCYPVQVAVARFKEPPHVKNSVMIYFGPDPFWEQPQAWYNNFNGRQTIEAGIKEQKQVFYLHHIKVRSLPAIILQEKLVTFAANFIRWVIYWMQSLPPPPAPFHSHTPSGLIKQSVHNGTHTSAYVHLFPDGRLIEFTHLSCFYHQALWLPHPVLRTPKKMSIFRRFSCFPRWLHKT